MKQFDESRTGEVAVRFKRSAAAQACAGAIALIAAGQMATVRAADFSLPNGVEGLWSLGMSIGSNWRARDPDLAPLRARFRLWHGGNGRHPLRLHM